MPDTAQARAEKAYPIQKESPYATNYIAAAKQEGYVLGWTESQREPISDAEVEAGAEAIWGGVAISWHDGHPEDKALCRETARTVLEAAARARVSAESEKP